MKSAVGSRLRCQQCGTEIIVVKANDDGDVPSCCSTPMSAKDE